MPNNSTPPAQNPLPGSINDLVAHFTRALNTARLYAKSHDLLKKQNQQLYLKLKEAIADRDFLFIGCARDSFFLEGAFYEAKESNHLKFLDFFYSLRISHILINKEITNEELESFIGILGGAQQGQGEEVSLALPRENIRNARVGLLDYTVFSTVQTVAAHLLQTGTDEAVWRQLILQPAGAGIFNLDEEQTKKITGICEDLEELKKLLLQMDSDMVEKQQGVSVAQRGILLGNFIQNLGHILSGIAPIKRKLFARHLGAVLDSVDPHLKTQILGAVAPDPAAEEEGDVVYEILRALSDSQLISLLVNALGETGSKSLCFNNLLSRALFKYKEPSLLLALVRKEMDRILQDGEAGGMNHWQHLEQILVQKQETEELDAQYHKEIEALATSIHMKAPMAEEEEMDRLKKTLNPERLRSDKAHLIVDLINQPGIAKEDTSAPYLLESLGKILDYFMKQSSFLTVGSLLREAFLALGDYPAESEIRKNVNDLMSGEDIRALLSNLLKRCHTYEPRETAAIDAVCQLYPEKAGDFLLDIFIEVKSDDKPEASWLSATLTGLGPGLTKILNRRLQGNAPDNVLPRLLSLAAMSGDNNLAMSVGQLLDHKNHLIRLEVISTLGKLKAEKIVPSLAEIVLQKSWVKTKKMKSLQAAAAKTLAEINTADARKTLQQAISEGSPYLKTICQELIKPGDNNADQG
jgi:hypothetical protein